MKLKLLSAAIIAATATTANAGTVTTDGQDLVLSTKGGLKVATKDKSASFQVGGRLQWDYDQTESDINNIERTTDDFDVRRARIYVKGHYGDWGYKAQFNVAESDGADGGDAEDLYIRYMGFGKSANITVGKQKEPFGLEEQTSSKDITALERSAMTEFYAFGRNAGIQLHGKGSNWTYGVGAFEGDGDGSDDAGELGFTGRVTVAPIKTDNSVVHIGAGFSNRSNLEYDLADLTNGLLTGDVEADLQTYNLELAGAIGPFHAQAEYFDAEVDVDADILPSSVTEDFDGYYLQLGWIITGESRPYKDGKFKKVKPSSPSGAWEVVLRYEDGDGKFSDVGIGSGEGEQLTAGVNYYANNNVRLGLSYMDGERTERGADAEGQEIRARVQFTF